MKKIIFLLFLLLNFSLFSQKEELVVHRTHSSDIELLEFSNSGKYLASLGENSEIIIWHIRLGRLLTTFYIDEAEEIENISFSEDEKYLFVRTKNSILGFDINHSKLMDMGIIETPTNRKKNYYLDKNGKIEFAMKKGIILKRLANKKIPLNRLSANSIETKLNAFDISPNEDLVIAAGQDGKVYIYKYGGNLVTTLDAHYSAVNDVRFSKDGKSFASAGKDRSIIIWNTEKLELESRVSSSIHRKNTVNYSHDGNKIYVGDELGFIFEIDLIAAFPKVAVQKTSDYAINKIQKSPNGVDYFIATSDNHVLHKTNPIDDKSLDNFRYKQYPIANTKTFLFKALGTYQPPIGEVKVLDVSKDGNQIIFAGTSGNPNLTHYDFKKNKATHLYKFKNWESFESISFINDNTIIANARHQNVIYEWKLHKNKFYYNADTLDFKIQDFVKIAENKIWINSVEKGQFIFNLTTQRIENVLPDSYQKVFKRNNYVVLIDPANRIIFYDYKTKKQYFSFKGHSDLVTDISFHPDGIHFVSSSYDGTVKLWDFEQKTLITTIIPFKNNDFIFITKDNYYLISKGAINDFGFKYKDQYFYPDLFDIKYNRPDLVLTALKSKNTELIAAYHQAYLKRLKKLNFTEDQLGRDFHLPEIEITNLKDLKPKTNKNFAEIKVNAKDSKYKLEKINVWLNGVAIYGVEGFNVSYADTSNFAHLFNIPLAAGKNRIEVSVQNVKGVDSYKKTYNLFNTNEVKESNLYLVSIGIGKFKENQYDLNYAAKDAKDIIKTFTDSKSFTNVYSREFTDEEVTLENINTVKPFLEKAGINDMVIVFVAGHGILDEDFNYYFATYDMDFHNPKLRGIPYEIMESLVDNLKALRKLLFIDTCHSGELEKDEVEKVADPSSTEKASDIIFRGGAGVNVKEKEKPLGLLSTNELMKSLFTDLRKGTGATIIASSAGTEYAMEGERWENGLFTYCLIRGLKNKEADLNKDNKINISELQEYIQYQVNYISNGTQTPTSRIVNTQLDYRIW
ncbi:hypothetical protein DNU06_13990 [Putridiphycobacter roseus]|uniref:Peptidase C14 caspase domain-containing protein n=1 Tax=Putridiphycobacter roseus TaxID=2219161 RepID=A0A2W1NAB4_9FLAO|nr:caspase family protein [Putridiphycobacter roseus]PZE16235.1 hypothetical protein DNU06_13990 [Putridiphycobacter roseus]